MKLTPAPCIFCKSEDIEIKYRLLSWQYQVVCQSCGAAGPEKGSEDLAILAWNQDKYLDVPVRVQKALEKIGIRTEAELLNQYANHGRCLGKIPGIGLEARKKLADLACSLWSDGISD